MISLSLSLLSFIVFDYDPGDDLECGSVLSQFWKGIEASSVEGHSRSTGNVFGHRRTRPGDRLEKSFAPLFFVFFFLCFITLWKVEQWYSTVLVFLNRRPQNSS